MKRTIKKLGLNINDMVEYKNRVEMLSEISKGGRVVEIGVYAGEYSEHLLEVIRPAELILIDRFNDEEIECGDANGNNIQVRQGLELYDSVCKKFAKHPCVRVFRRNSTFITNFADDYFDLIYIDGDHSFFGVLDDLIKAFRKIKDGGFIMCHDYNSEAPGVGVGEAIDRFCADYGQSIEYRGLDKSITVGIKIKKP